MINKLEKKYYSIKKHRRLANKKTLSKQDKVFIKNELANWLLGIEEDDQLPLEISCICFCFEFSNKCVCLSVSGFENQPKLIDKGSFSPLEAQFFYCERLNAFVNNKHNLNSHGFLLEKTKEYIFSMLAGFIKSFFSNISFKYLDGKKIIIGEFLHEKARSFRFNLKYWINIPLFAILCTMKTDNHHTPHSKATTQCLKISKFFSCKKFLHAHSTIIINIYINKIKNKQ